ncbi:MAG: HAMP domain-containing histidine kinase [Lachnospiraceae bacterium]|nr:HAMP domain-containing histidine kinase [Lachnospiraceae bacterium]
MGNNGRAGTKRSLRWFLIKRFLFVMFFIYASEEAIGFLYQKLATETEDILSVLQISISGGGNPISFALQTLLYSLATLLPGTISGYIQGSISKLMGDSLRIAVTSPLFTGRWGVVLRIIVIVVVLVILLISLLPWMIGAFYYYYVVTKKVNELIEEEKAQQLAYDRKRNLLLSDIAHDIKTPLTTLCGYSKALSDGVVKEEEKRQEYLAAIYNKSMRMNELITLLFEYVKMDSSGFELHREAGDLGELVRECTAAVYTDFEEKNISLVIDISEESMPCLVDKVQMARAVTNLLNNAVRYGKEGGKALVRLEDYCFTVADDGMAIDREFAEHIFEPFSRADKARCTAGGSGLGLSIAHKIVQMHDGELCVKLDYGQGYTKAFQIWMPSR